ncbi:MAG: gamma-carotene 1'-hydroxylase CruF [Prochlorotrichaceae cyanobacterium]|jgi:putative membrane protein
MTRLLTIERFCLIGHVLSMLFGLAGLLWVLPNPDLIMALPAQGLTLFQWSLSGGGVVYMVLAAIAVSLFAYRNLGTYRWLAFMFPAIFLSLGSELLGTSTGFPFGHYHYLSGLGYKIAGLVPFTIPLSWFYLGFSTYVLAAAGLTRLSYSFGKGKEALPPFLRVLGTIALGIILLTAWDLVLDPAMSQAPFKFWEFQEAGQFFGMPYRNLSGWMATGAVYMGVASLLWGTKPIFLGRQQLVLPLVLYVVNFGFGAFITIVQLDKIFLLPAALGVILGLVPALFLWWVAGSPAEQQPTDLAETSLNSPAPVS